MSVIPAFSRWRKEGKEFEDFFGCITSLRPAKLYETTCQKEKSNEACSARTTLLLTTDLGERHTDLKGSNSLPGSSFSLGLGRPQLILE